MKRGVAGRPAWLGALAPIAVAKECRFVDGVLETLVLGVGPTGPGAARDARLATVRHLVLTRACSPQPLWRHAAWGSLGRLSGPLSQLVGLGPRTPPGRLDQLRVVDTLFREALDARAPALPAARELLLAFELDRLDSRQGASFSLTADLCGALEVVLQALAPPGRFEGLGVEVASATLEGVAAWLAQGSARPEAFFVVHAGTICRVNPADGRLTIGPGTSGKAFEKRLLTVMVLLRELPEALTLRQVDVEGPAGVVAQRLARKLLRVPFHRRGDVRVLNLGGAAVLP